MRFSALGAVVVACALVACAGGYGDVVRMRNGRARVGRAVPPEAYAASMEASMAEERGDWPMALEWLKKAREEDPDAPDLEARAGAALCHLGKREAAMFAFGDALRSDPELELAYTSRAACRLMSTTAKTPTEIAEARADLVHAVASDPDAFAPASMLIGLDVADGKLAQARTRAEEFVLLHPTSALAWELLSELAAKAGDVSRAVEAATQAAALDTDAGARAHARVAVLADGAGVAAWALASRGRGYGAGASMSSDPRDAASPGGACAGLLRALDGVATREDAEAVRVAAEAVRTQCPELEGEVTALEVEAIWSPANAAEAEGRALSSTSLTARRWATRMRLRRVATEALLATDALPRVDDRETLALSLAAEAVRRARANKTDAQAVRLVSAARTLALAEPTVARLIAEAARVMGKDARDPWRATACAVAKTRVERAGCG